MKMAYRIELSFPEWSDDGIQRVVATTVVRGQEVEGIGLDVEQAVSELWDRVESERHAFR